MLGDASIEGVVIGGAEVENPSYARRALAAGKHVLMEKACGWTKAHADELIGTAKQKGLLFQVGYNFRPLPPFRRVIDMVRAGDFGTVHLVRAHMGSPFSADVLPRQLGGPYFRGGAFYNLGCHALDMVMAVAGTPDAVHPFRRQVRPESQAQDYFDLNIVVLEYPETLASIELSFLETENRRPRSFEVYGSEAQAIVTPFMIAGDRVPSAAIHTGGPGAGADGWHIHGADPFEPFRADIDEFAACIRGDRATLDRLFARLGRPPHPDGHLRRERRGGAPQLAPRLNAAGASLQRGARLGLPFDQALIAQRAAQRLRLANRRGVAQLRVDQLRQQAVG